jgi:hypothetical protein
MDREVDDYLASLEKLKFPDGSHILSPEQISLKGSQFVHNQELRVGEIVHQHGKWEELKSQFELDQLHQFEDEFDQFMIEQSMKTTTATDTNQNRQEEEQFNGINTSIPPLEISFLLSVPTTTTPHLIPTPSPINTVLDINQLPIPLTTTSNIQPNHRNCSVELGMRYPKDKLFMPSNYTSNALKSALPQTALYLYRPITTRQLPLRFLDVGRAGGDEDRRRRGVRR